MATNSTANIGFEKKIWDAACVLRGNMDASEYKSVVLGLIFLKYISDRFDEKYQALVAEGDGFEEEIIEVCKCINDGKNQSDVMPLDESIAILKIMDESRKQIDVKYPFD